MSNTQYGIVMYEPDKYSDEKVMNLIDLYLKMDKHDGVKEMFRDFLEENNIVDSSDDTLEVYDTFGPFMSKEADKENFRPLMLFEVFIQFLLKSHGKEMETEGKEK